MTSRSTLIESLATSVLDSKGTGAIWQLYLDAAHAHQTGYPIAADAILELDEAADEQDDPFLGSRIASGAGRLLPVIVVGAAHRRDPQRSDPLRPSAS